MKYKIKKTTTPYQQTPTPNWNITQFINFFKDEYKRLLKVKTHKPNGLILKHLNSKSINFLYNQIKDESPDTDKNTLYREYIAWLFEKKKTKSDGLIRVWFLSNKDIMTDFLDVRVKALVENELGSDEEFDRQEQERRKNAIEYYNRKENDNGKKDS